MTKTKKWTLIAAALIVIGLIVGFVGFAALDYDYTRLNTASFVTNTHTVNEAFSDISIEDVECDVYFAISNDGSCTIICREIEKLTHSVSIEGSTLHIRKSDRRKWYNHIGLYWSRMEIFVYLPKSEYEALFLTNTVGNIEVPQTLSFESTHIETTTGNVDFYASVKNDLSISTTTGGIDIHDISPNSMTLETSTGKMTIDSVMVQDDIALKTNTGRVKLTDVSTQSINTESTTGSITFENVITAADTRIRTSTGGVELLACDADSIHVETSTGSVYGTLLSEKLFIIETSTGNVNVPKTISGGICEIITSTGNIEFKIQ